MRLRSIEAGGETRYMPLILGNTAPIDGVPAADNAHRHVRFFRLEFHRSGVGAKTRGFVLKTLS